MSSIVELIDAFHEKKISSDDYLKGLDRQIQYAENKLKELPRQKIVPDDQALWQEKLLPGLTAAFEGMIGAATEAKLYAKNRNPDLLSAVGLLIVGVGQLLEQVEAASGKVSAATQQAIGDGLNAPQDGVELATSKGSADSTVTFLD